MWVAMLAEIAEFARANCAETVVHSRFEVPTFPDVRVRGNPSDDRTH